MHISSVPYESKSRGIRWPWCAQYSTISPLEARIVNGRFTAAELDACEDLFQYGPLSCEVRHFEAQRSFPGVGSSRCVELYKPVLTWNAEEIPYFWTCVGGMRFVLEHVLSCGQINAVEDGKGEYTHICLNKYSRTQHMAFSRRQCKWNSRHISSAVRWYPFIMFSLSYKLHTFLITDEWALDGWWCMGSSSRRPTHSYHGIAGEWVTVYHAKLTCILA